MGEFGFFRGMRGVRYLDEGLDTFSILGGGGRRIRDIIGQFIKGGGCLLDVLIFEVFVLSVTIFI